MVQMLESLHSSERDIQDHYNFRMERTQRGMRTVGNWWHWIVSDLVFRKDISKMAIA